MNNPPKSAKSRLKHTAVRDQDIDREVNREWSQADAKTVPEALKDIHAEAKAKGLDKLTMREINEEIAAYRREKDPLYGQTHRITVALSERMYRQLKAAAEAEGWNITWTVRQALGDYLEQRQTPSKVIQQHPRRKTTKAISEATEKFKTGRYEGPVD